MKNLKAIILGEYEAEFKSHLMLFDSIYFGDGITGKQIEVIKERLTKLHKRQLESAIDKSYQAGQEAKRDEIMGKMPEKQEYCKKEHEWLAPCDHCGSEEKIEGFNECLSQINKQL